MESILGPLKSLEEAQYLLGHLFAAAVDAGIRAAVKDRELRV